jgi:pSer/pThr/pTyr-binding forkhead associated (FHA) protein
VPESFDPDATRALAPAEALAPRVYLESTGRTYPLAVGVHEIGREPAAGVRLDGLQISRRHATLRVTETEAVLEDLHTVNGTFVNQQRLTAPRALAEGDVVSFGNQVFRIRFAPGFPPAAPEKPKPA